MRVRPDPAAKSLKENVAAYGRLQDDLKLDHFGKWFADNQGEGGVKQLAGEYRILALLESVEPHQ